MILPCWRAMKLSAQFGTQRLNPIGRMGPFRGDFGGRAVSDAADPTAWLGREDSNLRMAESKSSYFACSTNGHSEN